MQTATVLGGAELVVVAAAEAQGNLEAGLNASGIFRKNISKTEDWGETKQKLEVMPVYFPGVRSDGNPSLCFDENEDGIYDEGVDAARRALRGVAPERRSGWPRSAIRATSTDPEACAWSP